MKQHRVRFPSEYEQADIVVGFRDELSFELDWLESYFLESVQRGTRYKAAETIQIGWMILSIRDAADGSLELWEPDFHSMPIVWTRGVTSTLRHLTLQQAVCTEIGQAPSFPSIAHAAVVPVLDWEGSFTMSRGQGASRDSGWVFAADALSTGDTELRSLFEIALKHPVSIPFLALPEGAVVTVGEGFAEIVLGSKRASSSSNDLLQRIATARSAQETANDR